MTVLGQIPGPTRSVGRSGNPGGSGRLVGRPAGRFRRRHRLGFLSLPLVVLEALVGLLDLRLGGRAADPGRALDRLPGFEVFVDLEEVLDFQPVELGDVMDVAQVLVPRVLRRDAQQLLVRTRFVGHPEHADRATKDQASGKRGFLDDDEGIERITVTAEGVFHEAVVRRITGGGEQHAVQTDPAGCMVHFVLVALPLRDLDDDVEFHPGILAEVSQVTNSRVSYAALLMSTTMRTAGRTLRLAGRPTGLRRVGRRVTLTTAAVLVAGSLWTGPSAVAKPTEPADPPPPSATASPPSASQAMVEGLDVNAPTPSPSAVTAAISSALSDPAFGAPVGGVVLDATTGAVLWSAHPDVALAPASVTKLLTAAAALVALGPEDRPVTSVLTTGTVAGGRLAGDLVLRGGGDVLLAADGSAAWPARASLDQLVASLKAAGITRVDGRIVADGSLFGGSTTASSWDPSYVAGGSVAPVTALGVDEAGLATIRNRSADPRRQAATAFRTALAQDGVAVSGPIVVGQAPASARTLASVAGTPVLAEVEELLQNSDNDMAESLGRRIALHQGFPPTFAGAAAAVKSVVGSLGIPVEGVELSDASGLSHADRIPPSTIAALLRLAAAPAASGGREALRPLVDRLAVAAFDGTLVPRFRAPAALPGGGLVRAKTGRLTGVSSLAGSVVDSSGRQLLFVWMANGVRSTAAAESALDVAATALGNL